MLSFPTALFITGFYLFWTDLYLNTGQANDKFIKWLSIFRGEERPEDDLVQFLSENYDIIKQDLTEEVDTVNKDLRYAMDRLWSEVHEDRRSNTLKVNGETTRILIQHDIETYLGVVALRQHETVNELGYKHWLLTFDTNAWVIKERLKEEFKEKNPTSPLLSFTFLINSLTFGPSRGLVSKSISLSLPVILDVEMTESMPIDILRIVYKVREENEGLPEYVIRRKVRDAIDRARRQKGLEDNKIAMEIIED